MRKSLTATRIALTGAIVVGALSVGAVQAWASSTRVTGADNRFGCVEGNCDTYCQGLGFMGGTCPINGGHCICF
jgi:hypothetical protein